MIIRRTGLALAMLLSLTGSGLAAPSISVKLVSNTATRITIKVTGSGFSKKKPVTVEIDQNGAFSGNMPQYLHPTADSNGKISQQSTIDSSSACLIGLWATDDATGFDSNSVDVNIPAPCHVPVMNAHLYDKNGPGRTLIEYVASYFTPNGGVTVEFHDTTAGDTQSVSYAVLPDGTSRSHYGLGEARCGHVFEVTGFDEMNDKASNTVRLTLCGQ
jgi:hypothetical protein